MKKYPIVFGFAGESDGKQITDLTIKLEGQEWDIIECIALMMRNESVNKMITMGVHHYNKHKDEFDAIVPDREEEVRMKHREEG